MLWESDIPFLQLMFPGAVQPLDCHSESIQQPIENTVRVWLVLHAWGAPVGWLFLEEWRLRGRALKSLIPNLQARPVRIFVCYSIVITNNSKHSYQNCKTHVQHLKQNSPAWCCKSWMNSGSKSIQQRETQHKGATLASNFLSAESSIVSLIVEEVRFGGLQCSFSF